MVMEMGKLKKKLGNYRRRGASGGGWWTGLLASMRLAGQGLQELEPEVA